jgi:hypothetical protein
MNDVSSIDLDCSYGNAFASEQMTYCLQLFVATFTSGFFVVRLRQEALNMPLDRTDRITDTVSVVSKPCRLVNAFHPRVEAKRHFKYGVIRFASLPFHSESEDTAAVSGDRFSDISLNSLRAERSYSSTFSAPPLRANEASS